MKDNNLSRRNFILNTGKVIGAGAVVITLPQIFSGCEKNEIVYIDPPASDFYTLDLTPYPELLTPGTSKTIKIAGKNNDNNIAIFHHKNGTFSVMDLICPHQGCPVSVPSDTDATLDCPCHAGNTFSTIDGQGIAGGFVGNGKMKLKTFEVGIFDATYKTLEIKI